MLGNFVICNSQNATVIRIEEDGVCLRFCKTSQKYFALPEEINPIPITQNTLVLLGIDEIGTHEIRANKLYWVHELQNYLKAVNSHSLSVDNLVKGLKEPIVTTEDGVTLYRGDNIWWCTKNPKSMLVPIDSVVGELRITDDILVFSSSDSCFDYMQNPKPLFTTMDGKPIYYGDSYYYTHISGYITHTAKAVPKFCEYAKFNLNEDKVAFSDLNVCEFYLTKVWAENEAEVAQKTYYEALKNHS